MNVVQSACATRSGVLPLLVGRAPAVVRDLGLTLDPDTLVHLEEVRSALDGLVRGDLAVDLDALADRNEALDRRSEDLEQRAERLVEVASRHDRDVRDREPQTPLLPPGGDVVGDLLVGVLRRAVRGVADLQAVPQDARDDLVGALRAVEVVDERTRRSPGDVASQTSHVVLRLS